MGRAPCCDKIGIKKGRWTEEEDNILKSFINANGEGSWKSLPNKAGLLRCGKSCRLRWINYLREGLKRGKFSREEDELIIKLHSSLGNRWSQIAIHLPGRTDNEIKNYWNSHLSRSIDSYRHADRLPKNSEKNSEKIARTARKKRKNKIVDRSLNPQISFKQSNEKEFDLVSSLDHNNTHNEFSNLTDEVLWNSNNDVSNSAFSPIIFDNSEFWSLDPQKATREYSCTTGELTTSRDVIEKGPGSTDLCLDFKEMENLLNSEIEEIDTEHWDNNMLVDIKDGLLAQIDPIQEEEAHFGELGCLDFLWDLDLWSP